ncbi:PCNA-associated factor-like [Cataglyphis hispanica]|uniref:PCNA-associated factor-like n=1 Tax=Cataglyphis hispanica TaxID=1086592 RepID=UPI0021806868|nr:PCNA-associated factor-like [Cataglyphis hispanica]
MVRTKADRVPGKAVGSKAPGKVSAGSAGKKNNGRKSAGKSYGGGNPYHPRETPEWQKPITSFMNISSKTTTSNASPIKEKIETRASKSNCEDPNAEESTTEEDDETD